MAEVPDQLTLRHNRDREGRALQPILEGDPVIVVEHGKPVERNLRRNRITLEEVASQARIQQGIAHLEDVEWAVLETSGQISFIKMER